MSQERPAAVVFDLGGVLIDWDPRHLYRKLFAGDAAAMEWFLANVCTNEWNREQDRGRAWTEAVALLEPSWPAHGPLIRAYRERWMEMLNGPIAGSVTILEELRRAGVALHALTNWSHETFALARPQYPFLAHFGVIVVSGEIGLIKPDPAIFRHLEARAGIVPDETVYIDDSAANVAAATALGYRALKFETPERLRRDLGALGLLQSAARP